MNLPDQPIKLVHILYSGQGGLGTYFTNFVRSDNKSLFSHYAFFYGIEPLAKEYEDFCKAHDIEFMYVRRKSKLDFAAFKSCREFIKGHQIKFALLHTFSMTPFYFMFFRTVKVITIDHTAYQVKSFIEWVFTAWNHLFASKSIYFYPQQFNRLRRRFPLLIEGKNTHYVPKTVDVELFTPAVNKLALNAITIGTTGRIVVGKRHDLLIESIALLREEGYNISLKVAGDGVDLAAYKLMVKKKGLLNCVKFTGRLEFSEMIDFYQGLDAYIHASDGETICYSIMEAQACGLPILASNVDGINNVINHGRDGLLFENELDSIMEAIRELMSNKDFFDKISKRSRELAELNYNAYSPVEIIYTLIS